MAFFKSKGVQATTGDPFLDSVVSIQSDDYGNTYSSVGAIRNSDVFTAVSIIASDIASSPIQSIKDSMPQLDDEIAHLMNDSPNPIMDGWHFKYALVVNMLLNGNSFAEIIRKGDKVEELHLLPNSSVTVTQDDTGTLSYNLGKRKIKTK